jgi:SNF2 family DNA or RNA helicase
MSELRLYMRGEGDGRQLFAQLHPDPEPTEEDQLAVKRVGAARWQRKSLGWRLPCTVDKCDELRKEFGDRLKVDKAVSAWFRQAAAERRHHSKLNAMNDTTLHHVAPEFAAWLKPDQRVGAEWIANLYRNSGLLAPEGGVGKTATVVAGLQERQVTGSILVICPKISVKAVWAKEFAKWAPDMPVYLARGTRAQRQKAVSGFMNSDGTAVLVVVAEMLRMKGERAKGRWQGVPEPMWPELFDVDWDAVVVDEGHKLLGSMDVAKGNLMGEGMKRLNFAPAAVRLAVTATPWGKGGRAESLFGTLHWLWPDEYTSKWNWLNKFFEITDHKVFIKGGNGASKMVKKIGGLKRGTTEADLFKSLGPRILRYTMAEVSPAHAGLKNFIEVSCELEGLQAKQYGDYTEHGEVTVDGGFVTSTGPLDFLTRCRQFANGVLRVGADGKVRYTGESAKLDRLFAILEDTDFKDSTRKIVVATQYNEFLDVAQARFEKEGIGVYRLDGSTTEARREAIMNAFQGDPVFPGPTVTCGTCHVGKGKPHGAKCLALRPRVFLLNSRAGGVSITLDAADDMHILDEMYPPEANEQLMWRIFRRGRVHEVFYYLYRSEGTVDEVIGQNNENNRLVQELLMDGRRGLAGLRKLLKYKGEK